jgi:hypothetical protein
MRQLEQAFWDGLLEDRRTLVKKRNEHWRDVNALRQSNHSCFYCGDKIFRQKDKGEHSGGSPLHVDQLIPVSLGGPHLNENLVAACVSCAISKGQQDWLAWCRSPSKAAGKSLMEQRLRMLSYSQNHLIRLANSARKKVTVLRRLEERWQHPRCAMGAALTTSGGLIGWNSNTPSLEVIASLKSHGAQQLSRGATVWRLDPARFHDAVWTLIDLNAWVRRLDLGSQFADPTPVDDEDSRWFESSANINWLVRRRNRLPSRKGVDTRPTLAGWRPSALLKATSYSLR